VPIPPLIILPTYNERDNIEALVPILLGHADDFHLLIVDDGSPDGTADWVAEHTNERLHLLQRTKKEGLGPAYLAGFRYALERDYKYIFEMDADFSHHPRHLSAMLEAAETYDLVIGSRYVPGGGHPNWPWYRQAISRGGNLYMRTILGLKISDATSGFRCYRRKCLEGIDLDAVKSGGYCFQIEMAYRAMKKGFSIHEIPIQFEERRAGKSKMSLGIILEAFWRVWVLKRSI